MYLIGRKDIESENQRGPCCGLYALQAVAKAIDKKANQNIKATFNYSLYGNDAQQWKQVVQDIIKKYKAGNIREEEIINFVRQGTLSLRAYAKAVGITQIGEVFSCEDMKKLAKAIGLQAFILSADYVCNPENMKKYLTSKQLILAPFSVDNDGLPDVTGDQPHWCVIYGGIVVIEGQQQKLYVRVKHWGKDYLYDIQQLSDSNKSIVDFVPQIWQKSGTGVDRWQHRINGSKWFLSSSQRAFKTVPLSQQLRGNMLVVS